MMEPRYWKESVKEMKPLATLYVASGAFGSWSGEVSGGFDDVVASTSWLFFAAVGGGSLAGKYIALFLTSLFVSASLT